jgi:retron-type reverse transcriptase
MSRKPTVPHRNVPDNGQVPVGDAREPQGSTDTNFDPVSFERPTPPDASAGGPDPFDPASLRLSQDFPASMGVKKALLAVPVRKPDKAWFVRTHPDRDNLRLAVSKAVRGKRDRPEARAFLGDLDRNLADLAAALRAGTFPLGRYRQFLIFDPKERVISAPCFPERVLHHAVMNVCEPAFERWLIADTFACRVGKGRPAALDRARQFARRFPFFLKLDVRKYFDSVPHDRLRELLARRFKDPRLLELLGRIIGSFRGGLGRGLPIGSLTSQHLANFYLGWFDRFVKEGLRLRGYVRYMDDMALWADSKGELREALVAAEVFLREELGLTLKPTPYLNRTGHGMDFLGCRLYPGHLVLNRRSRRRFRRRLAALERRHGRGAISERELQERATALTAFTRGAAVCSWRFRQSVLQGWSVSGQGPRIG